MLGGPGWQAASADLSILAFIDAFQVPTVGLSLANYDDNQHTDNENLRLGNLWNGIATLAVIMRR